MSTIDALFAIGAWTLVFAGATLLVLEIKTWIRARALGLDLHIVEIAGMRLRGVRPRDVLEPLARGLDAGVELDLEPLEAHARAGGNAGHVVDALIRARDDGRDLSFAEAASRDLRGDLLPADPSLGTAPAPDNLRIESSSHPPTHTRGSS